MDRRTFVKSACLGTTGIFLATPAAGSQQNSEVTLPAAPPIEVHKHPTSKPSPLNMPKLYPKRVIELTHRNAIATNRVAQPVIRQMLEHGMKELTGERSLTAA